MAQEPDLVISAGFSDSQLVRDTNSVVAAFKRRGEEAQKAFQDATGRVTDTTAARAHARELDRLSKAYDPVYRAASKYEAEIKRLDRALGIGAINQDRYNAELAQAAQAVQAAQIATAAGTDQMATASSRAATSTGALSVGMGKAGGMSRNLRSQIQNASFQFSDFIVQVQGGTAATTAFAQQAPQLLGGFGALGAVLGLVAALAVPVGVALYKLVDSGGDAADMAEEFDKSLQSAQSALSEFNDTINTRSLGSIEALIDKYGRADQAVKDLEDRMRSAFRSEAFAGYDAAIDQNALGGLLGADSQVAQVFGRVLDLREQAASARAELDKLLAFDASAGMEGQFGAVRLLAQQNIIAAREDMASLNAEVDRFGISPEQIDTFNGAKDALDAALAAENFNGAVDALDTIQGVLRETGDTTLVNVADQLDVVGQQLREGAAAAGELPPELAAAANEALALADYLQGAVSAINSLQGAISNLGISNVGKQARLAALQAGSSAADATISGQVAQRRAELDEAFSGNDANSTGVERELALYEEGLRKELEITSQIDKLEEALKPKREGRSGGRGGGRKGRGAKEDEPFFEDIEKEMLQIERQISLIGQSNEAVATARARWELLDEAKKRGLQVNEELSAQIEAQAANVGRLTAELERGEKTQQQFDDAISGIADSMADALLAGDSLREGLAQVFASIAADILNSGIKGAIAGQFGGMGGGAGILNMIGGFFGAGPTVAGSDALSNSLRGAIRPGWQSGGYTGSGPRNQIAGDVHRGEYVMSAPAVQRIGLPNLEALHRGGGTSGGGDRGRAVNYHATIDLRGTTGDRELDAKIQRAGEAMLERVPSVMAEHQKRDQ